MDDLFLDYMDQRFYKKKESTLKSKKQAKGNGPVITISRQSGCSGNEFAENLLAAIHKLNKNKEPKVIWEKINKEIQLESAKELGLEPKKIKYVFDSEQRTAMNDIMESMFTKYYKNDRVIRKTIVTVIKEYACKGNKIIVGRAGVAIAHELKKSFHIKLMAPTAWRAEQIAARYKYSEIDALHYIQEVDHKRLLLIKEFYGEGFDDSIFDIVFNVSSISTKNAIQSCLPILKSKGII